MLKDIKKLLAGFGLDDSEVGIFLAAAQVGQGTVTQISDKAGVKRASAYDILRRLMLGGFVREISRGKVKRYEAVEPDSLLEKLVALKESAEKSVHSFEKFKGEINAMYGFRVDQPSVSYYEGIGGIKTLLLDALEDKKTREVISYASADYLKFSFGRDFLDKYWKRRTELKIPTRGIIPATPEAKNIFTPEKNLAELRRVKFVSSDACDFSNEIDIYADKVAIISLNENNPYGVLIKSESIANTQRSIYELLWNLLL